MIIFTFDTFRWVCEIQEKENFFQFRIDCAPAFRFKSIKYFLFKINYSSNDKKAYKLILDDTQEGMKKSLRRKSDSSLLKGPESRSSKWSSNYWYNEDDLAHEASVKKDKFKFRSGVERSPDEEYVLIFILIECFYIRLLVVIELQF